jgi:hypothetical protein
LQRTVPFHGLRGVQQQVLKHDLELLRIR